MRGLLAVALGAGALALAVAARAAAPPWRRLKPRARRQALGQDLAKLPQLQKTGAGIVGEVELGEGAQVIQEAVVHHEELEVRRGGAVSWEKRGHPGGTLRVAPGVSKPEPGESQ